MATEKETFPTWGFKSGDAQIFDLEHGQKLPRGWVDSPAKVKEPKADAGPEETEPEPAD